jgi:hypothetical protein
MTVMEYHQAQDFSFGNSPDARSRAPPIGFLPLGNGQLALGNGQQLALGNGQLALGNGPHPLQTMHAAAGSVHGGASVAPRQDHQKQAQQAAGASRDLHICSAAAARCIDLHMLCNCRCRCRYCMQTYMHCCRSRRGVHSLCIYIYLYIYICVNIYLQRQPCGRSGPNQAHGESDERG